MSNELATNKLLSEAANQAYQKQNSMQSYCFANAQAFEAAQRMATALSKATLVPKEYQGNIANCIIALEVAHRMSASPTMVMQNLYIVHGRPSWSSQFIISAVNSCGRFKPLRFEMGGEEGGATRNCTAWTVEKYVDFPANVQTLEDAKKAKLPILESPKISMEMAKAEGWSEKNGSKWKTMPELMLRYRAASFFGRLYAPEILMGMQSAEESEDIAPIRDVTPRDNAPLKEAFMNNNVSVASATEDNNPLNAILSAKPEIDTTTGEVLTDDPFAAKGYEIIASIEAAKAEQNLKYVMNLNADHLANMSPEWQDKIGLAFDDAKERLGVK